MKPTQNKSLEDIAREWDHIASLRMKQIQEGIDVSYAHVLRPCIIDLASGCNFDNVVDVGCGGGFLSEELAKISSKIVAVDVSEQNISLANKRLSLLNDITFINSSIEDYAASVPSGTFTLAIANMTLMNVLSLENTLSAIWSILCCGGHLVFTITHPCFWPYYWGYSEMSWFNYSKEMAIEAPFRISSSEEIGPITTHVHRSLEMYVNSLIDVGFKIERVIEPRPSPEIEELYLNKWKYPRFLAVRCIKIDK